METAKIPTKKLVCGMRGVDVFEINILRTTKASGQAAKAKGRKGIKKISSYGLACNFLKFNMDPVFNSLQKSVLWPRSVTLRHHCDMTFYISIQSRSQRLRSFWSAPRNQDLWANQCQNPAVRNLIGCCILPEVSLNRRFQRQEMWKDIRNWAKQKTQSKCHQMCIQFFAAKKHEKIISASGSHD